jgi:hypothetical protein
VDWDNALKGEPFENVSLHEFAGLAPLPSLRECGEMPLRGLHGYSWDGLPACRLLVVGDADGFRSVNTTTFAVRRWHLEKEIPKLPCLFARVVAYRPIAD